MKGVGEDRQGEHGKKIEASDGVGGAGAVLAVQKSHPDSSTVYTFFPLLGQKYISPGS